MAPMAAARASVSSRGAIAWGRRARRERAADRLVDGRGCSSRLPAAGRVAPVHGGAHRPPRELSAAHEPASAGCALAPRRACVAPQAEARGATLERQHARLGADGDLVLPLAAGGDRAACTVRLAAYEARKAHQLEIGFELQHLEAQSRFIELVLRGEIDLGHCARPALVEDCNDATLLQPSPKAAASGEGGDGGDGVSLEDVDPGSRAYNYPPNMRPASLTPERVRRCGPSTSSCARGRWRSGRGADELRAALVRHPRLRAQRSGGAGGGGGPAGRPRKGPSKAACRRARSQARVASAGAGSSISSASDSASAPAMTARAGDGACAPAIRARACTGAQVRPAWGTNARLRNLKVIVSVSRANRRTERKTQPASNLTGPTNPYSRTSH